MCLLYSIQYLAFQIKDRYCYKMLIFLNKKQTKNV